MSEAIVKVEHLSHRYSVQWAVRDINFEISQTGIVGLLGSNGAGKSTIMNIICGVLSQTEGNVMIDGIDLRKNPVAAKQNIGFLPQKPPLYGDLTVDEYLTYAAQLRQMDPKAIPAALETAKEKCGISHFSKRLIKNLSGGYQQRVGIAQAIIHNPRLASHSHYHKYKQCKKAYTYYNSNGTVWQIKCGADAILRRECGKGW